jgi:hypothetical protein
VGSHIIDFKCKTYILRKQAEIALLNASNTIWSHMCTKPAHVRLTALKRIFALLLQILHFRLKILDAVNCIISHCASNNSDSYQNICFTTDFPCENLLIWQPVCLVPLCCGSNYYLHCNNFTNTCTIHFFIIYTRLHVSASPGHHQGITDYQRV